LALLRVYAAIDRVHPRNPDGPLLEEDLAALGVEVGELEDVQVEFRRFADRISAERSDGHDGVRDVPRVPLVRVIETTIDVVAALDVDVVTGPEVTEALQIVARTLLRSPDDDEEAVARVVDVLRSDAVRGTAMDDGSRRERWSVLRAELTSFLPEPDVVLAAEVAGVVDSWCDDTLIDIEVEGNLETGVEVLTYFEHRRGGRPLDALARACMPSNWPVCNDFFIALTRRPERDIDCPGTTGGDPKPTRDFWCNIYEEQVGEPQHIWFPDTYLLFTWDWPVAQPPAVPQLTLRYELAPSRPGETPKLRVDEGFIEITEYDLTDTYVVRTRKTLLLDQGGQTLAKYACDVGWLDMSITQFTSCADAIHP
jgi:hypothetical protein